MKKEAKKKVSNAVKLRDKIITKNNSTETTLDDVMTCIDNWQKSNLKKGLYVEFHGGFYSMNPDEDFAFVEDRILAYGSEETLMMSNEELVKLIKEKKDEDGFVNI
jgi:hypothetical protein